jgi:flagellar FliJ protein
MAFHFKFQKLLEVEKFREEELVKKLSVVQRQLQEEKKLLGFLQSVLLTRQVEMGKKLCAQTQIEVFILFEAYFSKLNRDISVQGLKVKEAAKQVELVRENLLTVFKKRKVLEKLRERHEREYKEQMLKMENKRFEEIAVSRFFRKKNANH